jgi:isopenicillin N synthase-like dioxygenase
MRNIVHSIANQCHLRDGMVQVWSNDRYKSVEHRVVVNDNKPRFSFPLFFNPSPCTNVAPLPELLLCGDQVPLYRPYNWGEFMKTKKGSNFKNMGVENLQIYHFAINRDKKQGQVGTPPIL